MKIHKKLLKNPLTSFILFHKIELIITLVLLVAWIIKGIYGMRLEQDGYFDYAAYLLGNADMVPTNIRLFPGTGIFLALFLPVFQTTFAAGVAYSFFILFSCFYAIRLIDKKISLLALFCFPPIILHTFSVVSSDSLLICLLLLAFAAYTYKRISLGYILLGLALWVRLIAIAVIGARILMDIYNKKFLDAGKGICILLLSVGGLLLYNTVLFGDPIAQLHIYPTVGRMEPSVVQFVQDIFRALDWGWYRSVLSGVAYFLLLIAYLVAARQRMHKKSTDTFLFFSSVCMTLFVFSFGPTPFLEEYPRFLAPVFIYLTLFIKPTEKRWMWILPAVSLVAILL